MRIFVDSLIILIPTHEIEVLIPIHRYFIFSRYHSVAFPKLSSLFSLAITITVILFFCKKLLFQENILFLLDAISGTIWFVYLQKFGFRVVNCCFFFAWHWVPPQHTDDCRGNFYYHNWILVASIKIKAMVTWWKAFPYWLYTWVYRSFFSFTGASIIMHCASRMIVTPNLSNKSNYWSWPMKWRNKISAYSVSLRMFIISLTLI